MKKSAFKPAGIVAAAIALMPAVAFAADSHHDFAVRGIGALQCSGYLNFDEKSVVYRNMAVENWLLGYLSAENRLTPDTYDIMALQDPAVFPNAIAVLCKDNPKLTVESVVASLVTQLEPIKVGRNSPILELSAGKYKTAIRQSTLMLVENALREKKYYRGRDEGKFNPELQHALEKFQKEQSLPVTGLPDSDTIVRLLIESPGKSKR